MKRIKLRKYYLCFICFIVCICFVNSFNETTSRYLKQIEAKEEVIAKPILDISSTSTSTELQNMIPGDEREFEFSVTNKIGNDINEVLFSYNLEVHLNSDIPLTLELYDEQGQKLTLNNNKTDEEQMQYGSEVTRNYKAKIIWNANYNDEIYANKSINLTVTLNAIQVI